MSDTGQELGRPVDGAEAEARTSAAPRPSFFVRQRGPAPIKPRRAEVTGLRASFSHALEQRQFFVLLPFAIILGVLTSLLADAQPEPIALAAVGACVAAAFWLARRTVVPMRLLGLCTAFWLGFSLLAIQGALFGTAMLHGAAYGEYHARVDAVLAVTPTGRRVMISGIEPVPPGKPLQIRRARIVVKAGPPLAPGDIIDARIYFYAVPGPAVPNGADAEFSSYFQGIGAYGSTTAASLLTSPDVPAPERFFDMVRQTIGTRIEAVLSQPSRGIARAIITGDQSDITDASRQVVATAGLAHVIAISGLHLSLVAGGVFFALRFLLALATPLARHVDVKKLAAAGGIAAALFYYAISGGGAAALRSTVMAVLLFGAVVLGRRALSMRNVALAGLFTVLTEPTEIFRPGFQLSFAAVIGLVGIYEILGRRRSVGKGPLGYIATHFAGIALTSLIGGASTIVFAIYHFQQTSPLGIVGNLMIMPLVALVMMPAAMLSVLAMPFGMDRPFIWLLGWSVDRMLDVATLVAGWSQNFEGSPLLTPLALFIALLALAWFAFFTNRYRLIGPVLAVPAILLFALDHPPDVLVADTTQALAVRGADGLTLIGGKPGSFAVDVWGQTYRQQIDAAPPGSVSCDSLGCITKSPLGFTVASSKNLAAFDEDCANADLVVTHLQAPADCRAETTVIDADDLARGGVQWLRWDAGAGRFELRPAIGDLNRPWRAGR